jgi:hypothetical protein
MVLKNFQSLLQSYTEIIKFDAVNAKTTPMNIVNWQFFANALLYLGVYFTNIKIIVEGHWGLVNSA